MNYTIKEIELTEKDWNKNAGGKARQDVYDILMKIGFSDIDVACRQIERKDAGFLKKIKMHFEVKKIWEKALTGLGEEDTIVLQFPVINHTLFLNKVIKRIKKQGVKIVALIHDLDALRLGSSDEYGFIRKQRINNEELKELKVFDKIIVHNEHMKTFMAENWGVNPSKMHVLEIFDYLVDEKFIPLEDSSNFHSCIIAGNLKKEKANYVYNLPDKPYFELYGINFEGTVNKNVHYNGSFQADEIPFVLNGGFGLVWDGDSSETCSGAWGRYLKYNNPHKTSLYLACGIPVIIWDEAALAEYVVKHDVGILIKSLGEIEEKISGVTSSRYKEIKNNALKVSKDLREAQNTLRVLSEIGIN